MAILARQQIALSPSPAGSLRPAFRAAPIPPVFSASPFLRLPAASAAACRQCRINANPRHSPPDVTTTARNSIHLPVLAALMTATTAVCAQIQIPLPPVPVSLALFAVLLCGALLPPRLALLSMAAYLLLGCAGVPVFSGFAAGPSVLAGPTGGFLFGYLLCAPCVSLLLRRSTASRRTLPVMAAGTLICWICGACFFSVRMGSSLRETLAACVLPFIPGDLCKIYLAAALSRRLGKALQHL